MGAKSFISNMKTKNKILALVLAVIIIASAIVIPLVLLKDNKKPNDGQIADTTIKLKENNQTAYKVVIPVTPSAQEQTAAEEFSVLFKESTGIDIPIVVDTSAVFTKDDHIISIGNTNYYKQSPVNGGDYGDSGFIIKRIENSVIIGSSGQYGALYGTYEFLEINLGIKMFGFGETFYPPAADIVYLKDFDHVVIPSFDYRAINGLNLSMYDNTTSNRLRLRPGPWTRFNTHTTTQILPYDANHSEWFTHQTNEGREICLTNEDARQQFLSNLQTALMTEPPEKTIVMLGTMDNDLRCGCADCAASDKKYTYSGTYIRWVNSIAEDMEEWEKQTSKGPYTYSAFAYRKTRNAPVVYNESTKEYTPNDPSVVARHNVEIRFAQLYADWNHRLDDPDENLDTLIMLESWKVISDKFRVWTYSLNFSETLVWFNGWHTMQPNYQIYKDLGANEIFDQGQYDIMIPAFQTLKIYVQSKLMWDLSLNPTELAYEFIDHVYKDAAPYIKELFDITNLRFRQIDLNYQKEGKKLKTYFATLTEPMLMSDFYWPYEFLVKCEALTDTALAEISKITDTKTREALTEKVKLESISAQYLLLSLHFGKFTPADYSALITKFENNCLETGVGRFAESQTALISTKIESFRNRLKSA